MSAGDRLSTVLGQQTGSATAAVLGALAKHDTGRPRAVRAPALTESAAAVGARAVESGWLVATRGEHQVLHHAALTPPQLRQLMATGLLGGTDPVSERVTATCGAKPVLAGRPSALDAVGVARCEECCAAVGYAPGVGSPDADPACRDRLEARLGDLA